MYGTSLSDETKITAYVNSIIIDRDFLPDTDPCNRIQLVCSCEALPPNFDTEFKYSKIWTKQDLEEGDQIEFIARIKKSTYPVYITERWHDSGETLPAELIDTEEEIEIKYVKKIRKIGKRSLV